jgi:hypothetical protein
MLEREIERNVTFERFIEIQVGDGRLSACALRRFAVGCVRAFLTACWRGGVEASACLPRSCNPVAATASACLPRSCNLPAP